MHLLVVYDGARQEVVAAGTMTAREVRQKVSADDGVMTLGQGPAAVILEDEMSISEQGVTNRDRLILTTTASPSPLGQALNELSASASDVSKLEKQLSTGNPPHQELYTRILEKLDCIEFGRYAPCTGEKYRQAC